MKNWEKVKVLFEDWAYTQLGASCHGLLTDFHEEDGYADQHINAMWLGFNAGIELADHV